MEKSQKLKGYADFLQGGPDIYFHEKTNTFNAMRKNPNFTISAVLEKLNNPLKILKLKIPKIKNNQILVKIIYSGVCGSQLMEISGKRGKDKWLPHLLGHEGVGIVKEIGKSVKKFQINDEVILTWISCKGRSCINPTYKTFNNRKINSGKLTTFGNYTITSENKLVKKPKNMPLEIAPLFGCCIQTGAGIVLNQIKPKKKDIIVIIGLGGIGFSSLITLLSLKIKNIVCVDNDFKKLKIAKKLGVRKIVNSKNEDVKEKIMKVLKKRSADYCIEAAGKSKTIELGISIIKDTGKLVFASHPNFNNRISLNPFDLIKGKKIEGSWGGNCEPDRDIPKIYKLLKKNNTDFDIFFRKKYKLKDINNAIKDLKSGNVIRPIIEMDNKL